MSYDPQVSEGLTAYDVLAGSTSEGKAVVRSHSDYQGRTAVRPLRILLGQSLLSGGIEVVPVESVPPTEVLSLGKTTNTDLQKARGYLRKTARAILSLR